MSRTSRLRLTQPGPLVGFGLTGLVLGWMLRPALLAYGVRDPQVTWAPALLIGFAALCLGGIAWQTHSSREAARRLEPHRFVNRMVLGKASALVAAAMLGFYAGRGIGQWGSASELATTRMVQCGVAVVTAVAMLTASLLLERACLVRFDEDDDLPSSP